RKSMMSDPMPVSNPGYAGAGPPTGKRGTNPMCSDRFTRLETSANGTPASTRVRAVTSTNRIAAADATHSHTPIVIPCWVGTVLLCFGQNEMAKAHKANNPVSTAYGSTDIRNAVATSAAKNATTSHGRNRVER